MVRWYRSVSFYHAVIITNIIIKTLRLYHLKYNFMTLLTIENDNVFMLKHIKKYENDGLCYPGMPNYTETIFGITQYGSKVTSYLISEKTHKH